MDKQILFALTMVFIVGIVFIYMAISIGYDSYSYGDTGNDFNAGVNNIIFIVFLIVGCLFTLLPLYVIVRSIKKEENKK